MTAIHGSTRLISGFGKVHGACPGLAEIGIDGKCYLLARTATGYSLAGLTPGRRKGLAYTLPAGLTSCTCADRTYRPGRPGGCRHMAALRALAAAGKLEGGR